MINVDTKTDPTSTVHHPRPVYGAHPVSIAFSAWGAQPNRVSAASDGGRDDQAHIAVRVGDCLTYVYDRDALTSHLTAWREAAEQNSIVRLPTLPTATAGPYRGGQDMGLVCNTHGRQWHTVITEMTAAGATVITVAVGAVTVRVHSTEALHCYLLAWTQAAALGSVFDTLADVMSAAPGY